jgi:hypothetical protein
LGFIFISCKTQFQNTKGNASLDDKMIGVFVQFSESEDTSSISRELKEFLTDCKYQPISGKFKKNFYENENYNRLFHLDSVTILGQKGLKGLKQLLVCKVEVIEKKDEVSAKNNVWITFLGRWVEVTPLRKLHDFYYTEKVSNTGTVADREQLISFLVAQLHVKLCYDIEKYIVKKN